MRRARACRGDETVGPLRVTETLIKRFTPYNGANNFQLETVILFNGIIEQFVRTAVFIDMRD